MDEWNIDEEEFWKDRPDDPMHVYLAGYQVLTDKDLKDENVQLCNKVWETGDRVNKELAAALEQGYDARAKVLRGRMEVVVDYLYKEQKKLHKKQQEARHGRTSNGTA